jgi:hypothetical protein
MKSIDNSYNEVSILINVMYHGLTAKTARVASISSFLNPDSITQLKRPLVIPVNTDIGVDQLHLPERREIINNLSSPSQSVTLAVPWKSGHSI